MGSGRARRARVQATAPARGFDVRLHAVDGRRQHVALLRPLLEVREGRRTLGLAAERLLDRRAEFGGQRRLDAHERHARVAPLEPDLEPVGGVRIDDDLVPAMQAADRRDAVGVRADARDETGGRHPRPVRRAGELEAALALDATPTGRARSRDRGPPRRTRSARSSTPSRCPSRDSTSRASRSRGAAGSVPVRKNSSSTSFSLVARISRRIGSPISRATCPARMLPKLPEGTAKSTGSPCAFVDGEIAAEVVDDLRGDAREVDRIDGADPVARLERGVGRTRPSRCPGSRRTRLRSRCCGCWRRRARTSAPAGTGSSGPWATA